jgi:hypothetical protein
MPEKPVKFTFRFLLENILDLSLVWQNTAELHPYKRSQRPLNRAVFATCFTPTGFETSARMPL